ncbi:MAG: diguanylate cyclase [Actinomycetota bacterium]
MTRRPHVTHDIGKPAGRGQYLTKQVLVMAAGTAAPVATALIVVAVLGCLGLARLAGGAGSVAPHWFYLPVLFAAVRFGPGAALVTGVAAAVAAGPLLPLDVAADQAQSLPDWLSRGVSLVIIGQLVAFMAARSVAELTDELDQLAMTAELRQGLERSEFVVMYQPVVSLETGQVVGAEALVRWMPGGRPGVGPDVFIPVAEASGLIFALGRWVLGEACRQAAHWVRSLPEGRTFHISVNLSARQLGDPDLLALVRLALDEAGLDPAALYLEVTETSLIEDLDASVAALTGLKNLGVRLAIDDFGTGQSSLSYAHRFPVDVIKVDRSFVSEIESHAASAAVTAGIVQLAHNLGMQALAEGIETDAQYRRLQLMGCDLGQGYFFDRPGTPDVVTSRLLL